MVPLCSSRGVEAHQYARLQNGGGFLYFHQVAILQRLDEIRLHIGVGLVGNFPSTETLSWRTFSVTFSNTSSMQSCGVAAVFHSGQGLIHPAGS